MMWKYSKWIECYIKLKSFKANALHAHIKRCCVLNYGDEIDDGDVMEGEDDLCDAGEDTLSPGVDLEKRLLYDCSLM